jgi:hypothetical protein
MSGVDLDWPPSSCIDPRLAIAAAGEGERVHFFAFQHSEMQVTIRRNLGKRIDALPHLHFIEWRDNSAL